MKKFLATAHGLTDRHGNMVNRPGIDVDARVDLVGLFTLDSFYSICILLILSVDAVI